MLETWFQKNISNSNLVFRKKVDWVANRQLCGLDSEELEIVLLDSLETKNKAEYQYLMMLLEKGVLKYTIFSEKIEIEKKSGERIGGIPIGYKLEKMKKYIIRAYQEGNNNNIKDIEIQDSLSSKDFEEKALKHIYQYIESFTRENRYKDIFGRVQAIVANQYEIVADEIYPEFELNIYETKLVYKWSGGFMNPAVEISGFRVDEAHLYKSITAMDYEFCNLMVDLEEKFGVEIPIEEAEEFEGRTSLHFKELVDYIVEKIENN